MKSSGGNGDRDNFSDSGDRPKDFIEGFTKETEVETRSCIVSFTTVKRRVVEDYRRIE